jgi:DNA-binding transcriptional MerR regulator
MRISQAAQCLGVHPITLRRLEAQGFIAIPRDRNGQRRFSLADIERIRQVYYPITTGVPKDASHVLEELSGEKP